MQNRKTDIPIYIRVCHLQFNIFKKISLEIYTNRLDFPCLLTLLMYLILLIKSEGKFKNDALIF